MKPLEKLLALLLLIAVLLGLGYSQKKIFDRRINLTTQDRIFLLPRKEILKVFSLGHEKTVTDLLWIRAVQFFGGNYTTLVRPGFEFKGEGFRKLLDVLQYMDPHFYRLYDFGGFVFSEGLKDYRGAIEFLKKGSEVFANDWKLLFDAAFIAYFNLDDKELAIELASQAAQRPDAPDHVKRFEAQMQTRLGRFEIAERHFYDLWQTTQNEIQKQVAYQNWVKVRREKDILSLTEAVEEYRGRFGEPPEYLEQLVESGVIAALPGDEHTGPYYLVPSTGRVVSYNAALEEQQMILIHLQQIIDGFYRANGYYPNRLEDLMPEELIRQRVVDPLGGRFAIDPRTHQAYVIPAELLPEPSPSETSPE